MANSSISGLASGLDTASIIDQLMQLEAVPQNKLKTQQTAENGVIKALRSMNTDTALLGSSAAKLALASSWQTLKGTSTNSSVTVAVGANAAATTLSFSVDKLATTHQLGFATSANLTDVVAGSSITLTDSKGTATSLSTGGGTLQEVVTAINGSTSTTGVRATAVKVADGSYRLLAESTATGTASSFTLTNGDGTALLGGATVRAGADAQVNLGLGITATSATNTFTDLTPGVSVTLGAATTVGSTATITVAQNPAGLTSQVSALVDQLNSLLTNIDSATAAGSSTSQAGVLAGDPAARSLRTSLLNTVFGDGTTSMAQYGIQTDKYGKVVFDQAKFTAAYAADPAGVMAKFTTGTGGSPDGWAARVASAAKGASDTYTGTITSAISGHTSTVDRLTKSITDWDDRLAIRRSSLERQYTALETALNNMKSQSSWLAGQISGLPTYS